MEEYKAGGGHMAKVLTMVLQIRSMIWEGDGPWLSGKASALHAESPMFKAHPPHLTKIREEM